MTTTAAMTAPTAVPHRLLRAAVASAVATGVGAAAHLVAGGSASVLGAVAGLVVLLGPAWWVAGRERGWAVIAGMQLAGQQVVHAVLELTASSAHTSMLPDDVMLYGHAAAAVLAAVWLRSGERCLWAATRHAAQSLAAWWRWVLRISARVPRVVPVPHVPGTSAPLVWPGTVLRHVVTRRGPPLLA